MNTLESKIKEMNREILALKTAHPVASSLRTFYGTFNYRAGYRSGMDIYEITYLPGTNTIMTWNGWTWAIGTGELLFAPVDNNTQRFYDGWPTHGDDDIFSLFSTRPILSVRYIGNTHGE